MNDINGKIPIRTELESLLKPATVAEPAKQVRKKRTLGDIYTALEAQRIYNPGMPSVPRPPAASMPQQKPPTAAPANLAERGTAAALDMSGGWGKPEAVGEK